MPGPTGVMGCVLGIAVAEIVLYRSQVGTVIGEVVPAGMPKHVGPNPTELRLLASEPDDVIHGLAGELRPALRDEEPKADCRCGRRNSA